MSASPASCSERELSAEPTEHGEKRSSGDTDQPQRKKICYSRCSTGEKVHIFRCDCANPEDKEKFETVVQEASLGIYDLASGVTDVRVCHGPLHVTFVVTFISEADLNRFVSGPGKQVIHALAPFAPKEQPAYVESSCLLPRTHTLPSLLRYLQKNIRGETFHQHDVPAIQNELSLWFPRPEEWKKYIKFDEKNPRAYTRNLVFTNQHMDVILMCWPPGCKSSIHDHEESSCWVVLVEGSAVEVKFALPKLDRQFLKMESLNPASAVGRCGPLQRLGETVMEDVGGHPGGYVNNDVGIHRVENRSDKPAYTLHVYAPGLRKMRIFSEAGEVRTVIVPPWRDAAGSEVKGEYHACQHTDCKHELVEADAWNMMGCHC